MEQQLNIRVKTSNGQEVVLLIDPLDSIATLKRKIADILPLSPKEQRILYKGRQLKVGNLKSFGISENDVIVLLKARPSLSSNTVSTSANTIPAFEEIKEKTMKYLIETSGKSVEELQNLTESEQLPKETLSLSGLLERLIGGTMNFESVFVDHPSYNDDASINDAAPDEQGGEQNSDNNAGESSGDQANDGPFADEEMVNNLVGMGFPEARARKALILSRNDVNIALNWILQHSEDPDVDVPLSEAELRRLRTLERSFVPNEEHIRALQEMGFSREQASQALRATNNNREAATTWLLGDRMEASLLANQNQAGPVDGMSLIRALVNSEASSNPRILEAFDRMIRDPASIGEYVNDPQIGPVLAQVQRVLRHTE